MARLPLNNQRRGETHPMDIEGGRWLFFTCSGEPSLGASDGNALIFFVGDRHGFLDACELKYG